MNQRDVRTVASGFVSPESARWYRGGVWFVDQGGAKVHRLAGDTMDELAGFGRPMSLGFRPNGELLVADLTTDESHGETPHAAVMSTLHVYRDETRVESIDLSEFGAVNDMTVDRHGRVYLDVFARPSDAGALERWEPVGQVLLVPPDGEPRIVAEHIVAANGIGISPDGRTLVVGETWGPDGAFAATRLFGFDIAADGSLANRRVITTVEKGCCDGLCFDADGAIWLATASGGEVLRVADGEVVDRIGLPAHKWPLACALGGPHMRTLYICSVNVPPKGDPEVFPSGWDLTGFREGWIEAVEVDVPGVEPSL